MENKCKASQKKSTGSKGATGARRPGSGGGACRTETTIEARFHAVFESSRDAIGISKAGIHVLVNPAYLELFGFPPGPILQANRSWNSLRRKTAIRLRRTSFVVCGAKLYHRRTRHAACVLTEMRSTWRSELLYIRRTVKTLPS